MSRFDATAEAALDQPFVENRFFAFLDFANEPVRATTAGRDITLSGTGEPDLDGHTFLGIDPTFIDISPIVFRAGGSNTVKATLSGLIDLDNDLLNEIGDKANYQGRVARLWQLVANEAGDQQGAIKHYYTGYMFDLQVICEPDWQVIELTIEGYLAAHSGASGRTYDQSPFDSGDLSFQAAIAAANGIGGNPITASTPVAPGGGGGSDSMPNNRLQRYWAGY